LRTKNSPPPPVSACLAAALEATDAAPDAVAVTAPGAAAAGLRRQKIPSKALPTCTDFAESTRTSRTRAPDDTLAAVMRNDQTRMITGGSHHTVIGPAGKSSSPQLNRNGRRNSITLTLPPLLFRPFFIPVFSHILLCPKVCQCSIPRSILRFDCLRVLVRMVSRPTIP
jgi:hypothetical protein